MGAKEKRSPDQNTEQGISDKVRPKPAEELYVYKDSGVFERQGHIPVWLLVVAAVLLIWGIYYLIAYWRNSVG